MATDFNPFQGAIEAFVNDPEGVVARELERQGERVALKAQGNLSVQGGPEIRNPAPGPPRMRSKHLLSSVRITPAAVGDDGIEVLVTAKALAPDGQDYAQILLNSGYIFVDLEDLGGE